MDQIAGWLRQAHQHRQQGRLDEAERLVNRALGRRPDHAEALYLLGMLKVQRGRYADAVAPLERAAAVQPDVAAIHQALGNALLWSGRAGEALTAYGRVLALDPGAAEAHKGAGDAHLRLNRVDAAVASYREAVRVQPRFAVAHAALGNALGRMGQADAARDAFQRAIEADPKCVPGHLGLGKAYEALGRTREALNAFEAGHRVAPGDPRLNAKIGTLRYLEGDAAGALPHFEAALRGAPDQPDVLNLMALALSRLGRSDEAIRALEQAIAARPDFDDAYGNLGLVRERRGEVERAAGYYDRALALNPDNETARRNKLALLCFLPGLGVDAMFQAHKEWGDRFLERLGSAAPDHRNTPEPDRVLRVGYISPDFRAHPVAHFIEPVLAAHDGAAVEATCYAGVRRPDRVTDRLRGLGVRWRDISRDADEAVAERIRADGIDILVELAGHTAGSRLAVLARKPAPVQVSYLGYPLTTGLATVDYRLTDALADPDGSERYYVEKLVRLAPLFCCYRPADDLPAVAPPPAARRGHVTFGSQVNLTKVNDGVVALWSRVLQARPDARLYLFRNTLGAAGVRDALRARFREHGIAPERVALEGGADWSGAYLEKYAEIDVVLDTLPFCGHTTTCEALWMGVPVVTLAGEAFLGRMGVSLLTAVGLGELVADDEDAFVRATVSLTDDTTRLAALRKGMRARLRDSPLSDAAGFCRALEGAYRDMWRAWCEGRTRS